MIAIYFEVFNVVERFNLEYDRVNDDHIPGKKILPFDAKMKNLKAR